MEYAKELEAGALKVINGARGRAPVEKLEAGHERFGEAQENIHLVAFGNRVHNKKYSMLLLDTAITNF